MIERISAERWQKGLIEALGDGQERYFYNLDTYYGDGISAYIQEEIDGQEDGAYDTSASSGNAAFIVSDHELTPDELRDECEEALEDAGFRKAARPDDPEKLFWTRASDEDLEEARAEYEAEKSK